MRGEDHCPQAPIRELRGSPPHARGRRGKRRAERDHPRITPACAGKTGDKARAKKSLADHPRMRGEDVVVWLAGPGPWGSPPHARGRPSAEGSESSFVRITPACAGKTACCQEFHTSSTDHPRMRGEDQGTLCRLCDCGGSPPHARGRLRRQPNIQRP